MHITTTKPEDAPVLSAIAREAKKSWGYPESWMATWARMLTLSPEYLAIHPSFVATDEDKIVGFAVVEITGRIARLEHLWVRPDKMGRGIGGALFRRCEETARLAGAESLEIESDPHAEAFYLRAGAERVGELPADMEGVKRWLPLLCKRLREKDGQPGATANGAKPPSLS